MKILYLCIFLLYINAGFSQAQKISGAGEIQLGKTEQEILRILITGNMKITDGDAESLCDQNIKTTSVIRQKKCEKVTVYYVPEYSFENMLINNFLLYFHQGVLVSIFAQDDKSENELYKFVTNFMGKYTNYKTVDDDWSDSECFGVSYRYNIIWESNDADISVTYDELSRCKKDSAGKSSIQVSKKFKIINSRKAALNNCGDNAN